MDVESLESVDSGRMIDDNVVLQACVETILGAAQKLSSVHFKIMIYSPTFASRKFRD